MNVDWYGKEPTKAREVMGLTRPPQRELAAIAYALGAVATVIMVVLLALAVRP